MKKAKQNVSFLLAVILAFVMCSMPAYAAEQAQTSGTWNYNASTDTWTYTASQQFKNTWGYIENPWNDNKPAWFIFDKNGKMLTGWQLIYWDGSYKYFYFHEASDGHRGECQLGGITPDGYTVNEDGAWTVNGVVQQYSSPYTPALSGSSGSTTGTDFAIIPNIDITPNSVIVPNLAMVKKGSYNSSIKEPHKLLIGNYTISLDPYEIIVGGHTNQSRGDFSIPVIDLPSDLNEQ